MSKNAFADIAKKRLAALKTSVAADYSDELLEDFIVRIHGDNLSDDGDPYERPMHLGPILEEINKIHTQKLRLLLSVPPRHGKSYTILHLVAQILSRDPTKRIAYITYGEDLSLIFSRKAREFALQAGVEMSPDVKAASLWETKAGGSFSAVGLNGVLTGRGFDLLICDDPHKDRPDAESLGNRDAAFARVNSAIMSRVGRRSSVIVVHTRWHTDDVIGRLRQNEVEGWTHINLPAINEDGTALWGSKLPLDLLLKAKARDSYDWSSMYMGQPIPIGGAVFSGAYYYDKLPDERPTGRAIGIDLAYTAKTHADWSVAISCVLYGDSIYVTDVRRKQCEVKDFVADIKALKAKNAGAPVFWYVGGIEKAVVQHLQSLGVHVHTMNAQMDKFVRAQPVATTWKNKKVLLPHSAPWLDQFRSEVLSFTGLGDKHDDQVDALAAAHHPLLGKRLPRAAGNTQVSPF